MKSKRQIQAWRRANMLFHIYSMIERIEHLQQDVNSLVLKGKLQTIWNSLIILRDMLKVMPTLDEKELMKWYQCTDWHDAFK